MTINDPQIKEEVKELFEELDLDKDGKIGMEELKKEMVRMPKDIDSADIMEYFDKNKDGEIDYKEFEELLISKEEKLRDIFNTLDQNKDGKIDFQEIKKALSPMYDQFSDEEILHMLKIVDFDNDGEISFSEWRRFLLLVPTPSDTKTLFEYWIQSTSLDIGENVVVPLNKPKGQWWHYIIAGGVAGGVSRTATAPLDRIKTVLQLHNKGTGGAASILFITRSIYTTGSTQNGGLTGGIKAFFRGNGTNCIKIIPESSLKFFVYEYMKKVIMNSKGDHESSDPNNIKGMERFVAGAIAGAASSAAIYPLEVIKTRLAAPNSPYNGIVHTFLCGIKSPDGIRSLYKGLTASLLGIIPYAGIDLAVYEYLRSRYAVFIEHHRISEKAAVLSPLICGTLSSSVAQLVSYPLGLVRTRLQAQVTLTPGLNLTIPDGQRVEPYSGMIDVFQRTIKEEGFKGLYRGILPNYLKVIPAVSISYTVYESMKMQFGLR